MRKSTASISAAVPLSSKQYSIFPFQKPALKLLQSAIHNAFYAFLKYAPPRRSQQSG